MAEALGVDTRLIYSLTFGIGAALAGATGGLYAPTMTLVPTMGSQFITEAFVTVVIGRGRRVPRHGTGRRGARLHPLRHDDLAGATGGADRPAASPSSWSSGFCRAAFRVSSCVSGPEPWRDVRSSLRALGRLEGPQTLGRGPWFWRGSPSSCSRSCAAYPLVDGQLHGRQHSLLLQLGLHGAGPVPHLGLRRRAVLRTDRLLRHRRLRLRHHHAEFRGRLRH